MKKCLYGLLVVLSFCSFSSAYCASILVPTQKTNVSAHGNMANTETLELMNLVSAPANSGKGIYKISERNYGYCGRCGWARNERGCTNPNCNGYGPRRD